MPRNLDKRRCEVEGCRAWAMRGGTRCVAHVERPRSVRRPRARVQNVEPREGAPTAPWSAPPSIAELLDEELRKLLEVRALYEWGQRADDASHAPSPQFLRAWNDSVSRVVQLLRARRDLAEAQGGEFDELVRSVLDELSARLANNGHPATR